MRAEVVLVESVHVTVIAQKYRVESRVGVVSLGIQVSGRFDGGSRENELTISPVEPPIHP